MFTELTRRALGVLASAALLAAATPALAGVISFKAELKGSYEVPPNDSKATGSIAATYDAATKKFAYAITYAGLSGPATVAHFHGPAAPGANGGPELMIPGKPSSPIKGEATLNAAQATDLEKGLWYLNIHTATHPTGEIRGQLTRE
ncbi:MAG TPA: CHRD domain-containing protein [Myxococcota bacterium]|nr:CHRD domain-containing protein [Myxococcota bacterium]